jgi:N-methylhydantoinase B
VGVEVAPAVLLEVRQQLEEAAAAMDGTLRQAASSPAIGRHEGTAAGFYAATGTLLVGGRESHPLLLEAAAEALAFLIRQQAAAGRAVAAGDLFWTNDPRCGGAGLEDLILASPVVRDGQLLSFVMLAASHTALGRATLAPADNLRREGLALPWTRVGHSGVVSAEILDLLAANAEEPAAFLKDLRAQIHSISFGQAVMEDLVDRLGSEALNAVWQAMAANGHRAIQKILGRLEAGFIEGRVPPFAVRLQPEGDGVLVAVDVGDRGEPPSLSSALATAAVRAALREVLTAEAPAVGVLGGWADAVRLEAPWAAPTANLPVGAARFAGAQVLADAVLAAFAETLPHFAHAPDGGPLLLDVRGERSDGSRYRLRLELGAGLGASVFGDGMTHGTPPFHPQHIRPVEEIERAIPWRVLRFDLLPDSAGPGQYRGGLGAQIEFLLLEGRAEADVLLPGKAMGLRGGLHGAGARLVLSTPEEGVREQEGPGRFALALRAGHRLLLQSPGGGGWGIAYQRSIMRLEEDLNRDLISPHQSKNRYGVVLKPGTLEKDDHLTYRIRHYLLSTLTVEDIIAGEELLD